MEVYVRNDEFPIEFSSTGVSIPDNNQKKLPKFVNVSTYKYTCLSKICLLLKSERLDHNMLFYKKRSASSVSAKD
jgi:hypothetical protein